MHLLFLFLFIPFIVSSQTIYSGKVIDVKTNAPISYVTVGLQKENIGSNADESGRFKLHCLEPILDDTLIFTCVGYETKKVPVTAWEENTVIQLQPKEKVLSEVIVKNKWEVAMLGNYHTCGDIGLVTTNYQAQVAKHFEAPVAKSFLKSVGFCAKTILFFPRKTTVVRLRFYAMDSITKAPSYELCNEVVEVKSSSKYVDVDVEKYMIQLPKHFFVSIEWLRIPINERRDKSKQNGKISEHIWYEPSIGSSLGNQLNSETWMLNYHGTWHKWINGEVFISASIKY